MGAVEEEKEEEKADEKVRTVEGGAESPQDAEMLTALRQLEHMQQVRATWLNSHP
jgi:hypothetical protein